MAMSPDFGAGAHYYGPQLNTYSGNTYGTNPNVPVTPKAGQTPDLTRNQNLAALIAAEMGNYTPGTPSHSVSGGSSIVQTGPSLDQIVKLLGISQIQPPSLADLQKQAQAQTNLTINPQEDALRTLIAQLNSSTANQISNENALGAAQKSDIQETYNRLKAYTDAATQAGLDRYANAQQSVKSGNDQTLAALAQNQSNAQQATNSELSRLGLLGKGSTLDNTRLSQDAAFLNGLAQANANNSLNNISQMQANYGGVQNLLNQGQQQAGASALTKADNQIAQALAAIAAQQQSGLTNYNNQIQSLEGTRASQDQANLAALQQAAQQQIAQQQKVLLDAIAAAQSGLKTVSGGGYSVGATPAQGLSPLDAIKLLTTLNGQQTTQDQNSFTNQLAQNNYNLDLAKVLSQAGYNGQINNSGDLIKSILGLG